MDRHTSREKLKRFKTALVLTFLMVPFTLAWNLYGNFMIKAEFFIQSSSSSSAQKPSFLTPQTKNLPFSSHDLFPPLDQDPFFRPRKDDPGSIIISNATVDIGQPLMNETHQITINDTLDISLSPPANFRDEEGHNLSKS
jgi:hypothetical protein